MQMKPIVFSGEYPIVLYHKFIYEGFESDSKHRMQPINLRYPHFLLTT